MTLCAGGDRLAAVVFICSALAANTATAQGRVELSAGPVLALSGAPPTFGGQARIAVPVTAQSSPIAVAIEAFATEFRAGESGSRTFAEGGSTEWTRQDERQAGFAAVGGVGFGTGNAVPVIRAGLAYAWSGVHTDQLSEAGEPVREYRSGWRVEPVLGAGAHFRAGGRRVLVEGRVYGGQAVNAYAALTVGIGI